MDNEEQEPTPEPAEAQEPTPGPRLGSWARSGALVGLVVATDDGQVTIFDPGERISATVPLREAETVPAGAVAVTATVELPLPHGVAEPALRRWVASLLDETTRERAYAALTEAGLDPAAALPAVRVDVRPMEGTVAICLCGAKVPAPAGARVACPACGRDAVGPPLAGR
jgi:hypothetical protein